MYIYKIINLINGKIYVGKHNGSNPNYMGSGVVLKKAIQKYGIENFEKNIIEYCITHEQLISQEKYWILLLNSTDNNVGYNLTSGGDGFASGVLNPMHRPDVKEKHSIRMIGDKNTACRKDVREKISNTLLGRKLTSDHIENISKGLIGKPGRKGGSNSMAKEWIIIFPDKHEEHIIGLREFCRNNNLNEKLMRRTANGLTEYHKKFKMRYVTRI